MLIETKHLEWVLKHQREIQDAIDEYRDTGIIKGDFVGKGSGISKPTEREALRRLCPVPFIDVEYVADWKGHKKLRRLSRPESWLRACRATERFCKDKPKLWYIYYHRYLKNEVNRAQYLTHFNACRSSYYDTRDKILEQFAKYLKDFDAIK